MGLGKEQRLITNIEVIRLIAEAFGLAAGLVGGCFFLVKQIQRVLDRVNDLHAAIGDEKEPRPGTIRFQLEHQDKCIDRLAEQALGGAALVAEQLQADTRRATEQRALLIDRLARVEAKLNIPPQEGPI